MSGLEVRPGDKLFVPLHESAAPITPRERDVIKDAMEAEMPGVTVVVLVGFQGGPFVYRPSAQDGEQS